MAQSSDSIRYFSRDDLLIMLETYKNTVEPLTMILEQNKQILEKITQISGSYTQINTSIQETSNRLAGCAVEFQKLSSTISTVLIQHDDKRKSEFESLKHKINLLYVGMGSIVLGLIGIVIAVVRG